MNKGSDGKKYQTTLHDFKQWIYSHSAATITLLEDRWNCEPKILPTYWNLVVLWGTGPQNLSRLTKIPKYSSDEIQWSYSFTRERSHGGDQCIWNVQQCLSICYLLSWLIDWKAQVQKLLNPYIWMITKTRKTIPFFFFAFMFHSTAVTR